MRQIDNPRTSLLAVLTFYFRYRDSDEEIDTDDHEIKHLEKLKQKIEERKKTITLAKSTESDVNTINQQKTVESVATNEDIKEGDPEPITEHKKLPKPKKLVKENISQEFKVLGVNEFEKKVKVST